MLNALQAPSESPIPLPLFEALTQYLYYMDRVRGGQS
jgi:hypothetical protein